MGGIPGRTWWMENRTPHNALAKAMSIMKVSQEITGNRMGWQLLLRRRSCKVT
jgi:hypothetical protein